MKTIAILNLKGGVGKTVTAINLAYVLAGDHKKRVLVVDGDSQCNTTEFFGGDGGVGGLYDLLIGLAPYYEEVIVNTEHPGLDLLPASEQLMDLDLSKVENTTVHVRALRDLCEAVAADDAYDYVVIDLAPAFNAASTAALLAADEVIIPIKLDAFALRGMSNLMRQIANMRKINPRLRVAGCLITMWRKDKILQTAEAELRSSRLPIFRQCIRRSAKVDGMTFDGQPLAIYSPKSAAGVDYRRWVAEYIGGGAQNG